MRKKITINIISSLDSITNKPVNKNVLKLAGIVELFRILQYFYDKLLLILLRVGIIESTLYLCYTLPDDAWVGSIERLEGYSANCLGKVLNGIQYVTKYLGARL